MSEERSLPILVGEAPSRTGDRYHVLPLFGRPARVLYELAGIPPDTEGSTLGRFTWALYERFECYNLIDRYVDATPWPVDRAREAAEALLIEELPGDAVIVMLGRRVSTAFGSAREFYSWFDLPSGARMVCIPHPSGLNRVLNDPGQRRLCSVTLRAAMEHAGAVATCDE